MTVFAVYRDNGMKYEDWRCDMVKICSTREIAQEYIKGEEKEWNDYYEDDENGFPWETPTYIIEEVEVL